jgi:hypothetical protein
VARRRKTQVRKAASDTIRLKLVTLSNQFTVSLTPVTGGARPPPTQIVYNDGALSGGGTHATIAAAITAASSGSIVELRNRVGGTGTAGTSGTLVTWTQVINLNKAGVTVRVRDGDQVRLRTTGTLLSISANNCSVEGNSTGRSGLELGDVSQWSAANWNTGYTQTNSLYISGCSGVTVSHMTIHGARAYAANVIDGSTTQIRISDVLFSHHGTNSRSTGGDGGNLVNCSGKRVVFEDCDFRIGGHNVLISTGPYQIYRRCTGDGDFSAGNTGYTGQRAFDLSAGSTGARIGSNLTEYGPVLLEDCIFKNSGTSQDDTVGGPTNYNVAHKINGWRHIVRGCYYWDNIAPLWQGPGFGDIGSATGEVMARTYCYHNTSYNSFGVWRNSDASNTAFADDLIENRFVNNIFADLKNGTGQKNNVATNSVVDWDANAVPLGGYTNSWKGTVWRENIFQGSASLMNFRLASGGTSVGSGTVAVTVNNPDVVGSPTNSGWSANIYNNDLATSINFANPGLRTKAGFALTGGIGVGDAAPLTTAANSGSGSINLTVADAGYFVDGWSITDEVGDYIKIGSGQPVQITSINWSTNTITLKETRSWSVGAAILFAGNPRANTAGVVFDNRGAAQ